MGCINYSIVSSQTHACSQFRHARLNQAGDGDRHNSTTTCLASHFWQSIIANWSAGAKLAAWLSRAQPSAKLKSAYISFHGGRGQTAKFNGPVAYKRKYFNDMQVERDVTSGVLFVAILQR